MLRIRFYICYANFITVGEPPIVFYIYENYTVRGLLTTFIFTPCIAIGICTSPTCSRELKFGTLLSLVMIYRCGNLLNISSRNIDATTI